MFCYAILTAASCSASGLHAWYFRVSWCIYIYIYIYICSAGCVQGYISAIYAYMQVIYAYIEPLKYIYGLCHIHIFTMLVCLILMHFICFICANGCKWVQIHSLSHITCFFVLDIGNCTINLCCANYILTTSLTYDPIHD